MNPGKIILFGSGETSPEAGTVYEALVKTLPQKPRLSILETPAGFELNSPQVAGRIGAYLEKRLQNYEPDISIIPARKKHTEFSPDNPAILEPLLSSQLIFFGPGSPTYTVRHLENSLAWSMIGALHYLGVPLATASAGVIALGKFALPVYEIYKVGEDPHWKPGLDFFARYNLNLVFIPHWNNAEGGSELDTSHCFMGEVRFKSLIQQLPQGLTLIGIDERTFFEIDPNLAECGVFGKGSVHIYNGDRLSSFQKGERFPLSLLGNFSMPAIPTKDIPEDVWQLVRKSQESAAQPKNISIPLELIELAVQREAARSQKDWKRADEIRTLIQDQGWKIMDTPDGYVLNKS